MESESLKIVELRPGAFDLHDLSETLTRLKGLASRTPTPVTVEHLKLITESKASVLLLQVSTDSKAQVVGMVHVLISVLEDRALIGPICIDKDTQPRGHGTPLMNAAIDYVKKQYPELRRVDLTNRLSHDLSEWYKKFGFKPRTEESGDPATVYRLKL